MSLLKLKAYIDEKHRLTAEVPSNVPPGEVQVLLHLPETEDDVDKAWMAGISREWADELADPREDIYSMDDGKPIDEPR